MELPKVYHDPYADDYTRAFNDGKQSMLEECAALLTASEKEINQLRTQVEALREAMENLMAFQVKHLNVWDNPPYDKCYRLLKATPTQCLAGIKAQAVEDAVEATASNKYSLPLRDACDLYEYANQLRQAAKGGDI